MNKYWLYSLFGLVLLTCKSHEKTGQLPKPIAQEINRFSAVSSCKDAKVKQYEFQGQNVFVFEDGTCVMDKESRVLDKKGNLLGYLGGFAGNTTILGVDFTKAMFVKEVWIKSPAEPNQ